MRSIVDKGKILLNCYRFNLTESGELLIDVLVASLPRKLSDIDLSVSFGISIPPILGRSRVTRPRAVIIALAGTFAPLLVVFRVITAPVSV